MDALTLDRLIAELDLFVRGRRLGRPHPGGAEAIALEIAGRRDHWLFLEAARGRAGLYRLSRTQARTLGGGENAGPGSLRQALLLFRKHLPGAACGALFRIPGERTVVLEAGPSLLVLRLSGIPALTLVTEGVPLATLGGAPAWPLPPPAPEKEWDRVDPLLVASAVQEAKASGRAVSRAVLGVCPGLGPLLARELDANPASLVSLRARLAEPRPTLLAPGDPATWHDADLAPPDAVALAPLPLKAAGKVAIPTPTWLEAAALFLLARARGDRFARVRQLALDETARRLRRLSRLEAHLTSDKEGWPDPQRLRREAEALLAFPGPFRPGATTTEVPDPYAPDQSLRIALDPSLSLPGNADRLFNKARRIERARREAETRLTETRAALAVEQSREARLRETRDLPELEPATAAKHRPRGAGTNSRGASRHYLTSNGLSLLVGRGMRENHQLTFRIARPEDLWLHARDVPGAHVILRDPEGRAGVDDQREAAEVAAFFSEARDAGQVDVHLTRRKHVHPARGARGRVVVSHSDTLRVAPRDPEGWLRRR